MYKQNNKQMKNLITTKEELFEKFKGQSEANIKALVYDTMLGVNAEKNKLLKAAIEYHRLDDFYEYVKEVNWHLCNPDNGRPVGMKPSDYKELIEVLENNH